MMMKKTAVTASPKVALSWPAKVFALSYSSKDAYPLYPISARVEVKTAGDPRLCERLCFVSRKAAIKLVAMHIFSTYNYECDLKSYINLFGKLWLNRIIFRDLYSSVLLSGPHPGVGAVAVEIHAVRGQDTPASGAGFLLSLPLGTHSCGT